MEINSPRIKWLYFSSSLCLVWSVAAAAAAAKSLQLCPTLCDPIDGSPPGSPVPGILQARILEWVAISFSSASESEVTQSCLTLRDPMDCSLPGSSIHGIFQARVVKWGAIAFSEYLCPSPFINPRLLKGLSWQSLFLPKGGKHSRIWQ